MLVLLHITYQMEVECKQEFKIVQYIQFTDHLDSVSKMLERVGVRQSVCDEVHEIWSFEAEDVQTECLGLNQFEVQLLSYKVMINVNKGDYEVDSFMQLVYWFRHRFYIIKFFSRPTETT